MTNDLTPAKASDITIAPSQAEGLPSAPSAQISQFSYVKPTSQGNEQKLPHAMVGAILSEITGKVCFKPKWDEGFLLWLNDHTDVGKQIIKEIKPLVKGREHDANLCYPLGINPDGSAFTTEKGGRVRPDDSIAYDRNTLYMDPEFASESVIKKLIEIAPTLANICENNSYDPEKIDMILRGEYTPSTPIAGETLIETSPQSTPNYETFLAIRTGPNGEKIRKWGHEDVCEIVIFVDERKLDALDGNQKWYAMQGIATKICDILEDSGEQVVVKNSIYQIPGYAQGEYMRPHIRISVQADNDQQAQTIIDKLSENVLGSVVSGALKITDGRVR